MGMELYLALLFVEMPHWLIWLLAGTQVALFPIGWIGTALPHTSNTLIGAPMLPSEALAAIALGTLVRLLQQLSWDRDLQSS